MSVKSLMERKPPTPDKIHAEGPEGDEGLCGAVLTRYEPETSDVNDVTCLSCILLLQSRGDL